MTWNVPAQTHRVFIRNPLVAVVVEVRFFPILKIPDKIADFQDQVRARFPAFQEITRQLVSLGPSAPIGVSQERLFNFTKPDGSCTLTLSTSSLTIESRRHEHRKSFIDDVKLGMEALACAFGSIVPSRLGLRYVDVIDLEQVASDLGRATAWSKLVSAPFLAVPTGLADLEETLFACEVGSPVSSGGAQTLRFGLVHDGRKKVYRLDVDRYLDGAIEPERLESLLKGFADDVFAVFVAAMGPDLQAWMPERSA